MSFGRTLVVKTGALGDVLHALAGVNALRVQQPGTSINWLVDPRWQPLLVNEDGAGPVVDRVHLAQTKLWSAHPFSRRTARSIAGLWRTLRREPYDVVVDMQGTLRSAVLGRMAGGRVFAGFADPRERPAARLYGRRLERRGEHVVDQGAGLLAQAFGQPLTAVPPPLPRSDDAERWAEKVMGQGSTERAVLLAPTAGWGAKEWPAPQFATLARAMRAIGWRVLVNAPEGGNPTVASVVEASGGAATAVPCTVGQMVALTRRVGLVIGGDSGPVHLAAALGTPVVGLYGPTDPARNGPWGAGPIEVLRDPLSQTSYRHTATPDRGLARLLVDEVLAAAERILPPLGRP